MALYAVTLFIHPDNIVLRLAFNTLLLLVYVGVVLWNERALIRPIVRKKLHRK